jgi:hypothetical protein
MVQELLKSLTITKIRENKGNKKYGHFAMDSMT